MKTLLLTLSIAVISVIVAIYLQSQKYSGTTIHLVGDSTLSVQVKSRRPVTGWGEPLTAMLCDDARIINHAKNGRSSRSFLSEGLWAKLLDQLQTGDIVMIQFGHNDQKISQPDLYASPWQDYMSNLHRYVSEVRAYGAKPVLLTPIVRRVFNSQSKVEQTLGDYPAATRKVAKQTGTPLIDLNTATRDLVESLGPDESKTLYLHLAPNTHENHIEGKQDDTHLSPTGALEVATLAAVEMENIFPEIMCP